ncbi:MAG: D-2-hydroxyacid dehydrogenase [Planctomycetes bacterium]|nr:D-2-hydroxyacid dehydrogenase [Planctomycetota bacterium]
MRIVLCYPVESRHVAQIQAVWPEATLVDAGQERVADELPSADLFCGHPKVPVPWDRVVRGGRLKWIQSSAAGLDHCLVPAVVASDIVVTSASGVLADQVAEQTVGMAIACTRRFPLFLEQQARREFVRRPTADLTGATVGIVGLGGNGRRLVEVLAPFRVRILATDWFPVRKPAAVEFLGGPETLDDILPRLDILFLCAPLTEHTRNLLDARAIARMRRGAILVNVARGAMVDENALVDALESGHLDSAALDVTPDEPPAASSRLWTAPRLLITPHVGGQSQHRIDAMTDFFCDNLGRYRQGRPLWNLVDKRLGFPEPAGEGSGP